MKIRLVIICCLSINALFSQELKIKLEGKEYDVCTSLAYASKENSDSVKGLSLQSKGFKDFPKEVLKYRNIEILDLSAKTLDEMVEYLNRKEKRIYNKRKKNGGDKFGYYLFRPNTILSIPDGIVNLKKLKFIYLANVDITIDNVKKLEMLLPNCEIFPSSKDLEMVQEFRKQINSTD